MKETPQESPKPWHQQPGEGPRAYAAFRAYLELGSQRSLDAVGRLLYPGTRKRGKTGRLEAWSSRWRWVERATAHGLYFYRREDRLRRREIRRRVDQWIEERSEPR